MVEQWTENPCVPGSIPGGTTFKPLTVNVEGFVFFVWNPFCCWFYTKFLRYFRLLDEYLFQVAEKVNVKILCAITDRS